MSKSGSFTRVLIVIYLSVLMSDAQSTTDETNSCSSSSLEEVVNLVKVIALNQQENAKEIKKIASVQQEMKQKQQENEKKMEKIALKQQEKGNANEIDNVKELIGGNSSVIKEVANVVRVITSNQQGNTEMIKDVKELLAGNSSVIEKIENSAQKVAENLQENASEMKDMKELLASNASALQEVVNLVNIISSNLKENTKEIKELVSVQQQMKEQLVGNSSGLEKIANEVKRIASNQEEIAKQMNASKLCALEILDPLKRALVSALVNNCTALLIQKNINGSNAFNRSWVEYKVGFNDSRGNYWLGNDLLSQLTMTGSYKLRIDLQSRNNSNWYYAEYRTFIVQPESDNYRLTVSGYSGNTGYDEFIKNQNGMQFSTFDRYNDPVSKNCAAERGGGFWFENCCWCCVNSAYLFKFHGLPGGKELRSSRMWLQCM